MDQLLSCRVLFEAICVLPVLAYPFLPSASRSGVRCEIFLVWNALAIATFLSANNFFGLGWQIELWPLMIVQAYGLAGFRALRLPSSRVPEAEDFVSTAEHVIVLPLWGYLGLIGATSEANPESGWIACFGWKALAGIQFLVGVVGGYIVFSFSKHYLTQAYLHFITRRVSWWHWLPENGGANEFGPLWSVLLAMAVTMAPLVLFTAAIAGLH